MTDSLRDQIERVIEDHTLINGADECTCGVMWEVRDGFRSTDGSTCYDNHLADAVVAALGLEVEEGECGYCHAQLPGCRYSTWENNV